MKTILDLLQEDSERFGTADDDMMHQARIKDEYLTRLMDSLTPEQRELLDAFDAANMIIEDHIERKRFRYAFHVGAAFMAELKQGQDELFAHYP